jgi:hypothetical protein
MRKNSPSEVKRKVSERSQDIKKYEFMNVYIIMAENLIV